MASRLFLSFVLDEGFGVGHTRKTQTKGVWMWGEPMVVERGQGQKPLKVLLFDTEGFEATGKADAYDDRIFALSTILSAVLVYNLPETVRESDVQVPHSLYCPHFMGLGFIFLHSPNLRMCETAVGY